MKQRELKGLIEKTATGGYRVLASTAATDRQGEIIAQDGWDLKNFMKNPVMLWAHDYSSLPVAKVLSFPNDLRGLVADYEFAPAEANPMAGYVKQLVDGGFLNAVSVGFIPKERNGNTITKSELLEISFVPVPANQEALQMACKSLVDTGVEASEAENVVAKFMTLQKEADKGAVADEVSAEENYEAKWAALDPFFDIVDAMLNVYLSDDTSPDAFPQLIAEVITLLQPLAGNGGTINAALRETLLAKFTEGVGKGKGNVAFKIGAQHSAATKEAITGAIAHMAAASKQLSDLVGDESDDEENGGGEEDGTDEDSSEAAAEPAAEKEIIGGADELRALLKVRGMLGGEENKSRHALSAVNALIEARR